MPLIATFAGLDRSERESLADIRSPLLLGFAALLVARERAGVKEMSAGQIAQALEAAGVAVSVLSVQKALGRAGNRVSKRRGEDGERLFTLMLRGEREVENLLDRGSVEVFRFDGTAPRRARQQLGGLLAALHEQVRISDPYFGVRTLDTLDRLPAKTPARFLTATVTDSAAKVTAALRDFGKEHPNVEFRLVPHGAGLHDRYIVTDSSLLLVGHGLKDIGAKESFLVSLDAAWAPDLVGDTIAAFDVRWAGAAVLN